MQVNNGFEKLKGEQWAALDVLMTPGINSLVEDIKNGTAIGVSDGSFKDEFGTAAWVIENVEGTQRIMGNVLVPGYASDHSAYRSEIAGLYGMVVGVETIARLWNIQKGR